MLFLLGKAQGTACINSLQRSCLTRNLGSDESNNVGNRVILSIAVSGMLFGHTMSGCLLFSLCFVFYYLSCMLYLAFRSVSHNGVIPA